MSVSTLGVTEPSLLYSSSKDVLSESSPACLSLFFLNDSKAFCFFAFLALAVQLLPSGGHTFPHVLQN